MKRVRLGTAIVAVFFVVAIAGPWLAPYDPGAIDLDRQYSAPSFEHPLGTGDNGVDLLSSVLHGARLAGIVGAAVTLVSLVAGTLVGLFAGYRGGTADHVLSGFADVVQAFPATILQIAIVALVDRPGVMTLVVALSMTSWVLYARIARAQALALRDLEFVQAARALGASEARVMLRHVAPNLAGPLIIQASGGFAATILHESTLSFLGLGPSRATSWGTLLEQGSAVLLRYPHVALAAGAVIAITVLGFNLFGDTLRDLYDPRTRRR